MYKKRINHKEMKKLVMKVVADCRGLADEHIRSWQPFNKDWPTLEGAVYLRLSDDTQVAVERGSLEQQIHIAISEAVYRSEQERMNYRITEFYIEPGITGTHGNRPEFIRLQQNISLKQHSFVIFKEISRLVRDLEIWKRFFRLCQKYDCEICLRGLPFNPNDPASILQLDQLAAFAEFESRTTSKRIKESHHSAMLTSGKFNTHYPLLGFDVVRNEYGECTGIYTPNEAELKQVELIMKQFLRVDRYNLLIDWCRKMNIKTKRGENFTKHSIRTLLTNPRYIGKWYRNKQNEGKRQNKLMPYERYTEVKLGHGCVIDEGLWQRVQDKVKEIGESRAQSINHCYPLSGLLFFHDKSTFVGASAWGRKRRSTYYHNRVNKIRVRTEIFEKAVETVLHQIIENSPEFQVSVANHSAQKATALSVVAGKIAEIDTQIGELADERQQLDRRLNFLLEDDDLEMARSFREEYKERVSAMKGEERELADRKRQLHLLQKQVAAAQEPSKNSGLEQINKALGYIKNNDMVSLKSIYKRLFHKIIVRPLDAAKVELQFVFNNMAALANGEVGFCASSALMGTREFESLTSAMSTLRSNQLSYAPLLA